MLVGVCIMDFLCPTLIVNLNSNLTGVQPYNEGDAQVVDEPYAKHH